ncbi:amidohydrolase [Paenibacillus flagellatus]|uniref:Amidohydrolase n=1 Tax=Paenibacillus flagellatus TaxID=2211139 RepID=A0A2V5JVS8_9BACL|nr:amidohydrolase [Paenibacillus flagellatus]PYI50855.1 amidohydrolase [Paenibacillus flagellatus]
MTTISTAFRERAASLQPQLVAMRRELHRFPELSNEEYETTSRIRAWLTEAGIRLLDLDLPTGVLAEVKGARPGPTILLRADIDALPVNEETGLPYTSQIPGKMHACGHDFHTVSMIGATKLLQELAGELDGTVRILFQPAEELAVGARAAIEAGVLEGVTAVFGMHNKPELPVGTIGIRTGPLMASVDRFEIDVFGKGGHAGIPDAAVDPIVVSSAIVGALQTLVSRGVSPHHSAVVSVCKLQSGSTWNVIPDSGVLEGTVRTFQPEARSAIPERMKRIVESVAEGYGAQARLHWTAMLPAVNNDGRMAAIMRAAAAAQGLQVTDAIPTMGGEDFALYQERVPGCFIWMGTGGTEQWHHPKFTLNEDALAISASYFAETAAQALKSVG